MGYNDGNREFFQVTGAVMFDVEDIKDKWSDKSKDELIEWSMGLQNRLQELVEQQDREDVERLRFFTEATHEGLLVHERGIVLDANPAALRMLGHSRENLLGKPIYDLVAGGWRERMGTILARFEEDAVESIWINSAGQPFAVICQNTTVKAEGERYQVISFRLKKPPRELRDDERARLAEEMWDLYNNTPCGYHSVDEHGTVIKMNVRELEWLGYEPEEIIGAVKYTDLMTAQSRSRYMQAFPELKKLGSVRELELDLKRKNGTIFPVLLSATAICNEHDRFVMSRAIVFEMSERKRAAENLRESEEKFRSIAEQSIMGIFILQENRLIYANESFRRISGYRVQEVYDWGPGTIRQLFHPEDRPAVEKMLELLRENRETMQYLEVRGVHKNGQVRWLSINANPMMLRGIPSIFCMIGDITETKHNEEEKRAVLKRAVRHQTAINKMATGEAATQGDLHGAIREITEKAAWALEVERVSVWLLEIDEKNLRCESLYEMSKDSHTDLSVVYPRKDVLEFFKALESARSIITHEDEHDDLVLWRDCDDNLDITAAMDAGIRLEGRIVGALRIEHVGSARKWTTDEVSFSGEAANQVTQAIMSHRRKEAEEALRQAEAQVRALNKTLEERVRKRTAELTEVQQQLVEKARRAGMADIATSVLHNVGNILTSVLTSAQTIEKTVQTSSLKSMQKANQLVHELVDRNNTKSKGLVEFYHVLEDLLQKEHDEIGENIEQVLGKIDLIRDVIMAQQSFAAADSHAERLVLAEIVDDALNIQEHALGRHDIRIVKNYSKVPSIWTPRIKAIHVLINIIKNAREAMSIMNTEERLLTITITRDQQHAVASITDTGEGIAEENLDKIFTHGFSTKKKGHGFGLHSCANAMKEMGGTIGVTSEGPGRGATFKLSFPVKEEEE